MTVGAVAEPTLQRGSDYARLSKRINAEGLLQRRPGWYAAKILLTAGAFIGGWVAFFLVGDSWWQALVAVFLAVATTQVAFLGHDAGHRQMFRTRRPSEVAGLLLGNFAIGLSFGWWIDKHTRHHANPNHEDDDPDVGAGALVWTQEQTLERGRFGQWLAKWQAYYFFPILSLEGLNLHYASVVAMFKTPMRHRRLEAVLLVVHAAVYLGAVFTVLSPGKALVFIAIHQALWGIYMGCSFAPNHKGMPVITNEDNLDYLRKQVLTARNVRGGPFVDFALGGLNYQIEHHLFPSMPRSNLRKAQPIVRAYCAEHGIAYEETGLIDSYAQSMRYLHEVGNPPR
jgi:fatty acid desaturase